METIDAFKARAEARTGVRFEDLPDVPAEALLEGQILCQRDGCFVVTQGYPVSEDPETGVPVYGTFGVVDRARLWEPAGAATPQVGDLAEILKGLTTEADLERHGRQHKSESLVSAFYDVLGSPFRGRENNREPSSFALAMPPQFQGSDPVESYRAFYKADKASFAKWERPGAVKPLWW